jgi:hypothetical protein
MLFGLIMLFDVSYFWNVDASGRRLSPRLGASSYSESDIIAPNFGHGFMLRIKADLIHVVLL